MEQNQEVNFCSLKEKILIDDLLKEKYIYICGPIKPKTENENLYFIAFQDYFSSFFICEMFHDMTARSAGKAFIKSVLLKHSSDYYLHYVTFAYNCSPHSTTHEIPAYLIYGRDLRMQWDLIHSENNRVYYDHAFKYSRVVTKRLQNAFKVAKVWQKGGSKCDSLKRVAFEWQEGDNFLWFLPFGDTPYIQFSYHVIGSTSHVILASLTPAITPQVTFSPSGSGVFDKVLRKK
ncbi:hypothetical protein B566_EDAN016189, partial [Ephemera danica]